MRKFFYSILIIAVLFCISINVIAYFYFKNNLKVAFIDRYKSDEAIISNTFRQLELASDIKNRIAVLMLSEITKKNGIPSDRELDDLAKKLNINGFYVVNKQGRFLRSSDLPIAMQHNSLYSYDPRYKDLIYGHLNIATTPIVPSYPYDIPAKLTMIPNYNRTLILESNTHLEYIEKILHEVISADKNIQSVGLYAPTGYELGSISSDGTFHQGRRLTDKKFLLTDFITGNTLSISTKIFSNSKNCIECVNKKVATNGEYYYILVFQVSLSPLMSQINTLKYQVGMMFIIMVMLSVIFSAWLSGKLVNRIKKINATVNNIMEHQNLSAQVDVSGRDEIATLADNFNKMIRALKVSQANMIEAEKKTALLDLAARVTHDIASPVAVMTMCLPSLEKNCLQEDFILISRALQRIRDIANNLLNEYRDKTASTAVSIKALLDDVVLLKRQEWLKKDGELKISFDDAISDADQVIGSEIEIKRMLSNLLNNAIEACQFIAKIEIRLHRANRFFQIDISDNGSGMPQEKIIEYLEGKSSKHAGSGLGLQYANKYMKSIGGELLITSRLGMGTVVTLKFITA